MDSAIPLLATLSLWAGLVGVVTYAHKRAYGYHWWSEPSSAAAMGFMGLLVLLMWSGLIVYAVMQSLGLVI